MKKGFEEFLDIFEGDSFQKGVGTLKHKYLDDKSKKMEVCLEAYEKQRELVRLQICHEWLRSGPE